MSYRLEFKGKKYWIKESRNKTEIHYNVDKGCSDIYTVDSATDINKIMVLLDKIPNK